LANSRWRPIARIWARWAGLGGGESAKSDAPDEFANSIGCYRNPDFHGLHPGACNFLFGDGSIRFIKEMINPQVFSYLATRGGGEVVSADQF
jgi:prepilin-type processing-associated H-X9-DG protein